MFLHRVMAADIAFSQAEPRYVPFFETKLWLKSPPPLGRLSDLNSLEIEPALPETKSMSSAS